MENFNRDVEVTTALVFREHSAESVKLLAEHLEKALLEVFEDQQLPTLHEYMVEPDNTQIHVGFRFVGIDPDNVSALATKLLNDAVKKMAQDTSSTTKIERSSTLLVGI